MNEKIETIDIFAIALHGDLRFSSAMCKLKPDNMDPLALLLQALSGTRQRRRGVDTGICSMGCGSLGFLSLAWGWLGGGGILGSRRLATLWAQCRHRIYNLTDLGLTHKHKREWNLSRCRVENAGSVNGLQTTVCIQHSEMIQCSFSQNSFIKFVENLSKPKASGRASLLLLDGLTNTSKLNSTLRTMLKPGTDQNSIWSVNA